MVVDVSYIYLNRIGESVLDSIFGNNDIEISAQSIQEACSFYNPYFDECEPINESSLEKVGLKGGAASKINSAGKDVAGIIKKDGINKESKAKIHNRIGQLFEELGHDLSVEQIMDNGQLKEADRSKVKSAAILLIWILVISTLANTVLSLLFGRVGSLIYCCAGAPLVEEAAKAISVKGKFDKEFFILFNVYEAGSYILYLGGQAAFAKALGMEALSMKQILRARGAAIGMHGVNTIIHKIFDSEKVKEKFKINDDEQDAKDKATTIGYVISLLVHSTWNLAASLSPAFSRFLIGSK